jgi:hypothetical protein
MSFQEFYSQVYLPRHPEGTCRLLHLLGLPASVAFLCFVLWARRWWLLPAVPVPTYLVAWLGHVAAGNRPTFFEHPLWSFFGYWKMIADMVRGRARGVTN